MATSAPGSTIEITLPFPVSVNSIWRGGRKRVFKSAAYITWINEAHLAWLQQKPKLKTKKIYGFYRLSVVVSPPDKRRRDLSNLIKVLEDFCQTVGIIEDDSLCRELHMVYSSILNTPHGACLIFESIA